MGSLTIAKLKGKASFQDLGRDTTQHLGFSGSGAADEYSYLLANNLLGNGCSDAAIEVTLGQVVLVAKQYCKMVITGANCQPFIFKENRQTLPLKNGKVFELFQGDTLHLGIPKSQLHSYIAIAGGFSAKHWLGSVSQTTNEMPLGFTEPTLSQGDKLFFSADAQTQPLKEVKTQPDYFHQSTQLTLRFLPSTLWHNWTPLHQEELIKQHFTITPQSNRMGYRMSGEPLRQQRITQSLSKPVNLGAIQLPADGQPIVLMKERQTIGGYPLVGTVIQTDLFRLSQKRPGEQVNFVPVTLEQAQAQLLAFKSKFGLFSN
ncbi:biotin-dependent carboxyltransferase family protein [Colwelliaceae bacterium 6441]